MHMLIQFLFLLLTSSYISTQGPSATIISDSIHVQVYETFDAFEKDILLVESESIYVVNFWATWCVPCVKELPYFLELEQQYSDEELKLVLVSLDYKERLENKVYPFLKEKNITSKVVLLNDGKANKWIDRVDPTWSGAIPITLFIKDGKRWFYEQEFHSTDELIQIIKPLLKSN